MTADGLPPSPGVAHRTARNAGSAALANVIGKFATLLWTVLAARMLGQDDFGAFFYALSFALLLSSLAEWGFEAAMAERASRDLPQLSTLFTRSVTWQTLIGVPLFLGGGVLIAGQRPSSEARIVLACVLAASLVDVWGNTLRAAAAAAQEQRGASKALVFQRILTLLLITIALASGAGVVGLAAAYLAGTVTGSLAGLFAVRPLGIRLDRSAVTRVEMLAYFRSTTVLGLTVVVLMSLFRIDTVLLGALKDDTAVGAYAAAYRLMETVLFVAFALRSAIFPVMTAGSRELVRTATETAVTLMAAVYLPFAAVCLTEAGSLLELFYGADYAAASSTTLRWLAPAPMVYGLAFCANAVLQSRGLHLLMLWAAVLAATVNIGLNLILIPAFGGPAAAFATTASYAVAAVILLGLMHSQGLGISLLRPLREGVIAAAVLAGLLIASPLPLLAELPLGGVVYVGVWLALVHRIRPGLLRSVRQLKATS